MTNLFLKIKALKTSLSKRESEIVDSVFSFSIKEKSKLLELIDWIQGELDNLLNAED